MSVLSKILIIHKCIFLHCIPPSRNTTFSFLLHTSTSQRLLKNGIIRMCRNLHWKRPFCQFSDPISCFRYRTSTPGVLLHRLHLRFLLCRFRPHNNHQQIHKKELFCRLSLYSSRKICEADRRLLPRFRILPSHMTEYLPVDQSEARHRPISDCM